MTPTGDYFISEVRESALTANLGALGDRDNLGFASHRATKRKKPL
jgi:hypothetical protein